MDTILEELQGKAFHLTDEMFDFLSQKYEKLALRHIEKTSFRDTHPEALDRMIQAHRSLFRKESYVQSRINNPTSGTIDHIHAEAAADYAGIIAANRNIPSDAVQLARTAAHLHDIDRSYPDRMTSGEESVRDNPEEYRAFKEKHSENSAALTRKLAQKISGNGFRISELLIEELCYLVLRHEKGGEKRDGINMEKPSIILDGINLNDLADIVRDADSISYFDANILTNWEECGKNISTLSNKVHFMYDRMSPQARNIMKETILYSDSHILGTGSYHGEDADKIRKVLLSICS